MQRCLDLASLGAGEVAPNPMVGAVLVYDNKIIGEGFHQYFGEAHAEVNAINHVISTELLGKSTLYVNLEPCSHQGKTPPCANLIIDKRIPRVIIGTTDPNKLVSGRGISLLKNNSVKVITGVLENKCKTLNKRFFSWHQNKRPYIILKWARSADGFIDYDRPADAPIGPNWITSRTARILVHKWRAMEQAILVGTRTVIKDDPGLNVRDWSGKDPLRVIIDRKMILGEHLRVFDNRQNSLVFTDKNLHVTKNPFSGGKNTYTGMGASDKRIKNPDPQLPRAITEDKLSSGGRTRYAGIVFDDSAEIQMLDILYRENIQSVIIEGGAFTLNRFIEKGLWDEARIFTGPVLFKRGIRSPAITGNSIFSREIGNSLLQVIHND